MAYAGYLVRAVPKPETDIEFSAAYLNSEHGKKTLLNMCKSIVGMANINAQEMRSIPIPLPPSELQKKFGDIVRAVESRRELHHKATAEAEILFQSLQHRAFIGQI
jgi:type I restriction enzyme S subunit